MGSNALTMLLAVWLVLAMAHTICLACVNSGAVGNAMYMILNVRPGFVRNSMQH